jgi:Ethanolamine utilization protein EutJ (predicted chaperonin)
VREAVVRIVDFVDHALVGVGGGTTGASEQG